MRIWFVRLIAALAMTGAAAAASAQFGHPLKGTWSGDWGPNKTDRTHVVLQLDWNGKALTGVINPGPAAVPMRTVELSPSTWTIHVEADGKNASGKVVRYAVDGKLQNIGAYQRFITGTWVEDGVKGDFKVVRN